MLGRVSGRPVSIRAGIGNVAAFTINGTLARGVGQRQWLIVGIDIGGGERGVDAKVYGITLSKAAARRVVVPRSQLLVAADARVV